jgi:uncharacterized protein with PQ loop repeat
MDAANIFQILGTTVSLIKCASSFPQIMKTYRTKCSDSLSGSYLAILVLEMLLILSYALYRKDIVFIWANIVSLLLTGILTVIKKIERNILNKHISCFTIYNLVFFGL